MKDNGNYKVGIVGCGRISGHHCRSIKSVDGLEIIAVCDLIKEKAEAYGFEFEIPFERDHFVKYLLTEAKLNKLPSEI